MEGRGKWGGERGMGEGEWGEERWQRAGGRGEGEEVSSGC